MFEIIKGLSVDLNKSLSIVRENQEVLLKVQKHRSYVTALLIAVISLSGCDYKDQDKQVLSMTNVIEHKSVTYKEIDSYIRKYADSGKISDLVLLSDGLSALDSEDLEINRVRNCINLYLRSCWSETISYDLLQNATPYDIEFLKSAVRNDSVLNNLYPDFDNTYNKYSDIYNQYIAGVLSNSNISTEDTFIIRQVFNVYLKVTLNNFGDNILASSLSNT